MTWADDLASHSLQNKTVTDHKRPLPGVCDKTKLCQSSHKLNQSHHSGITKNWLAMTLKWDLFLDEMRLPRMRTHWDTLLIAVKKKNMPKNKSWMLCIISCYVPSQSVSQQPVLILADKILTFNHLAFAPYPGTKVAFDVASWPTKHALMHKGPCCILGLCATTSL